MTLIRRYKNETLPSVAVTVDLLTTGIDVPAICNLVFVRRVNSRILYEQMLGRATRLCDGIGKDCFEIYDAVGACDSMQAFTDMKPVVIDPSIGFEQLMGELTGARGLSPAATETAGRVALDQLRAKLGRKAARMDEAGQSAFHVKTGMSIKDLADQLSGMTPMEAAALVEKLPGLGAWLDRQGTGRTRPLPVSEHPDELVSATHVYGMAANAEDYLELFRAFIEAHATDLAALRAVTTKPSNLTRKDLRELLVVLDEAGFAESTLREAYRDATNADIAASVIGFIRRQALGDDLLPWDNRVSDALARLRSSRPFTPPQEQWLDRIARQMKAELVVDRAALDSGVFRDQGGFDRINRIFNGTLERTLEDMVELMWKHPA
jgi:type I restriction enzyme R subunit